MYFPQLNFTPNRVKNTFLTKYEHAQFQIIHKGIKQDPEIWFGEALTEPYTWALVLN